MNITTVGLDLAKSVFHVVCFSKNFKEVKKRMLRRNQVLQFFTQLPPCRVGMEACASSHYWGRELRALGHTVKLIPPQEPQYSSTSRYFTIVSDFILLMDMKHRWYLSRCNNLRNFMSGKVLTHQTILTNAAKALHTLHIL